ncbi:hypothetical protein SK128_024627 [Halocaridina rubra]|uniref:Uncharacterized protein n=1 Tax=Halocaridina rubra TaxID=373956 RepID=A0AAN9A769_HALRR
MSTLLEAADRAEASSSPSSSERLPSSLGNRIAGNINKNSSVSSQVAMRLARKLRVISPEDYSLIKDSPITLVANNLASLEQIFLATQQHHVNFHYVVFLCSSDSRIGKFSFCQELYNSYQTLKNLMPACSFLSA